MRQIARAAAVVLVAALSGCGSISHRLALSSPSPSPTTLAGQTFVEPKAAGIPSAYGWDGVDGRMMVVFPIHTELQPDRSVWTLDGATWKAAPAPAISSPGLSMLVYDSQRNRVVLMASQARSLEEETWEWDGRSWSRIVTLHSLRMFSQAASAAYSPRLRAVVAYEAGMDREPTYLYDGTDWTSVATQNVPPPFVHLEYDPKRQTIVGLSPNDWRTWLFDGVNWTVLPLRQSTSASGARIVASQPGGRQGPAIAFDERSYQWVVFGGNDGSRYYADTWVGDGGSWTMRSPQTAPQPRSGLPGSRYFAWDPFQSRLVLFGGEGTFQDAFLSDTWTWDGKNWTKLS
jgi:hypothetical protein